MRRYLGFFLILVIGGGSAALFAYSMGSLALDEFGVPERLLGMISLLLAGFIAVLLALDVLSASSTALRDDWMHRVTTADIVISVGRGLIMAAAIVGATYFIGNWYLDGGGLEALYNSVDDKLASRVEQAIGPVIATEATQ